VLLPWFGSLAGRLAILLAAFMVLATVAVVAREYGVREEQLVAETHRMLDAQAEVAADRLEKTLAERRRLVSLWADLETSQDLAVDDVDKRVSLSLADLVATLGGDSEAIAGRPGVLVSASDPARLQNPSPEDLPPFVETALAAPEPAIRVVGPPGPGAVVASADVVSSVDGRVLGRIVVWTPLRSFLAAAIPLELGTTELVATDGTHLARGDDLADPDDAYLWGEQTASTVAGRLGVRVGRARAQVVSQARASGRQLLTLAAVFLLLALPAVLLVVHSTTSSLGRLTRAAREMDPHHPDPLPPVSGWAPVEVRVLAEAMGGMVERLERAREELARSESLAAVGMLTKSLAHEIRTPLSVLRAGTEMLQRASQAPRDREVSEMLQAEVERLARLVDDLLVFGRPSPPVPRAMDLRDVAANAVSALEGDAAEKGVALTLEGGDAAVRADPDQLRQVVVNLVTNAVRACEQGGSVVVRTGLQGDAALLQVEDDGVGIPPEKLDEIWKPLVTTHPSGNGLGLPIVRQLVEAHGGTVNVHSVPGQGTRMDVMLPIHPETEQA
jgi:signal transduction histidine kinase